jgi:pre-mRNA-splicing factor ATP-dependent RNA helicase DHX16
LVCQTTASSTLSLHQVGVLIATFLSNFALSYLSNAVASSSKSPEALFSTLQTAGLPNTPEAQTFSTQVFARAPRKHKHKKTSDGSRKQAEKEAKELRSQKFSFLLDDNETSGVEELKRSKGKEKEKDPSRDAKSQDKKDRRIRKRETDGKEWESDEEEHARKRQRTEEPEQTDPADAPNTTYDELLSPEEEEGRKEAERLRDLKERDAFAERMRDKDKDRTKKVVEDRSSRQSRGAAAEAAERRQLADDTAARVAAMPSLREQSRQAYLTKRELQQIELLRKEIADDEALFHGMKISKRERRDLEYKKQVLKLAEDRMKIDDKWDGYQLPEDYLTEQGKIDKKKKESALYSRYEEQAKEGQFVTDVDQWEQSQTKHSTFKSGAMDRIEIIEDYEYVFDESQTIQFVMENTLGGEGMISSKDAALRAQIAEAERRGETLTHSLDKKGELTI